MVFSMHLLVPSCCRVVDRQSTSFFPCTFFNFFLFTDFTSCLSISIFRSRTLSLFFLLFYFPTHEPTPSNKESTQSDTLKILTSFFCTLVDGVVLNLPAYWFSMEARPVVTVLMPLTITYARNNRFQIKEHEATIR